jgi:hypothetical protein
MEFAWPVARQFAVVGIGVRAALHQQLQHGNGCGRAVGRASVA